MFNKKIKSSYKKGDILQCVSPKSNAYHYGKEYKVIERGGVLGLMGDDGLFDPLEKLVSVFKLVKE